MADQDWQSRIKTGRNDECPCGSKKKYKKCHMEADQQAQSAALAKVNADAAAKVGEHDHEGHDHDHHGHEHSHRHEKGGPMWPNTSHYTSKQISAPRKTGSA